MENFLDAARHDDDAETALATEMTTGIGEDDDWYKIHHPILQQLNSEARGLQENFTKYCFQAVSICSVTAGVIFHYMNENAYVGVAAVVLLPIVLITSRLGTNSYASIHRILGYELHLARTADIPDQFKGRWRDEYRKLKWEEAMRAWRIVQPSVYDRIYTKGHLFWPAGFRQNFKPNKDKPLWFCQKSLLGKNRTATWYPGTYLQVMQRILYLVAGIALTIMFLTPMLIWMRKEYPGQPIILGSFELLSGAYYTIGELAAWCRDAVQAVINGRQGPTFAATTLPHLLTLSDIWQAKVTLLASLAFTVAAFVTLTRRAVDRQRRKAMEDGLLSIHSCAIVWQAVVIAHYEAVALSRRYGLSTPQLNGIIADAGSKAIEKLNNGTAEDIIKDKADKVAGYRRPDGAGLMGYTFWLGQQASSLAACAANIHDWNGFGGANR